MRNGETIVYSGTLVTTTCWCGIHLAIPNDLYAIARRNKGHAVYCPLGHEFIYDNTTQEQLTKARQELAEANRRRQATTELLHAEERSHSATRGHLTRQKRKLVAGVCPVDDCQRHFRDLERHIETKHPGYRKGAKK
jgi:hypothetical protein